MKNEIIEALNRIGYTEKNGIYCVLNSEGENEVCSGYYEDLFILFDSIQLGTASITFYMNGNGIASIRYCYIKDVGNSYMNLVINSPKRARNSLDSLIKKYFQAEI